MFRMSECAAIANELDEVDWFNLLLEKGWIVASTCSTRWYGAACTHEISRGGRKLPWITSELSCLKIKKTKAAKRSKASEKRCLEDEKIDDCEGEHLRGELL
jgi:hypothetical protein